MADSKVNGYTENGEYRKFYGLAKSELVKRHAEEHKAIMVELGYQPKVKKVATKKEVKVVKKQ
jgi:hypothetical protein